MSQNTESFLPIYVGVPATGCFGFVRAAMRVMARRPGIEAYLNVSTSGLPSDERTARGRGPKRNSAEAIEHRRAGPGFVRRPRVVLPFRLEKHRDAGHRRVQRAPTVVVHEQLAHDDHPARRENFRGP